MDKSEKLAQIVNLRVKTPFIIQATDLLQMVNDSRNGLDDPMNILITGSAGSGKSTVANYLRGILEERDQRSVTLTMPFSLTSKSFLNEILERCGAFSYQHESMERKMEMAIDLIENERIQWIIIDDAHRLRDSVAKTEVMNCMKSLMDRIKVPFLLLGLHDTLPTFGFTDQLARRFCLTLQLKNYELYVQDKMYDLKSLLRAIDSNLPFDKRSELEAMAIEVADVTDGNIASVMMLIQTAARIAVNEQHEYVHLEDMVKACDLLHPTEHNPFVGIDNEDEDEEPDTHANSLVRLPFGTRFRYQNRSFRVVANDGKKISTRDENYHLFEEFQIEDLLTAASFMITALPHDILKKESHSANSRVICKRRTIRPLRGFPSDY
jgi:hypothetical protein